MSTYIEIWRPNESIEGWFDHEHCKSSVMGRDGLYQGCTGQPLFCFGAGRGRRKKSGWGRAGQGREQNPRGGPRTVEPYQGILRVGQKDHKPISSGQCLFFNKYDFFVFFCLFFIHHLVHFLSGSTGRAWRGVHPWIILLRLLLNYTWLLDYKSTSVYSVSSILIHLTWKINFIKRSGKYSIARAHAWNCNRTKRLLLWVSLAWRGTQGGFFCYWLLGKGSENKNGNLKWHLPWRGGRGSDA